MLLDYLVNFCDKEYRNEELTCICEECEHPFCCPGNCEDCLDEVHFPGDYPGGKREYDCRNMLNFYVCKYSHKYCSEIEYALRWVDSLKKFDVFNVMSIGCGASPDLMALEYYCHENNVDIPINYWGYDKNPLWQKTHNEIKVYGDDHCMATAFKYVDVVQYFNEYYVEDEINIIFLQYVISHFYNTGQIGKIDIFFNDLVDSIFARRTHKQDLIIFINDVNSNRRGRDHFSILVEKLIESNLHGKVTKRYFDHKITNECQRFGDRYPTCSNLHPISDGIKEKYKPAIYCSSAQLIVEVNGEK